MPLPGYHYHKLCSLVQRRKITGFITDSTIQVYTKTNNLIDKFLPSNVIVTFLMNLKHKHSTAETIITITVNKIDCLSSLLRCPCALPPLSVQLYSLSSPGKYENSFGIPSTDSYLKRKVCLFVFDCLLGTVCTAFKNYFSRTNHNLSQEKTFFS